MTMESNLDYTEEYLLASTEFFSKILEKTYPTKLGIILTWDQGVSDTIWISGKHTLVNSEVLDEMPQGAFGQALHCLQRQKRSSEKEISFGNYNI